jgi:phage replication-related protein YjqB (UPF0714/DUF867 family)
MVLARLKNRLHRELHIASEYFDEPKLLLLLAGVHRALPSMDAAIRLTARPSGWAASRTRSATKLLRRSAQLALPLTSEYP